MRPAGRYSRERLFFDGVEPGGSKENRLVKPGEPPLSHALTQPLSHPGFLKPERFRIRTAGKSVLCERMRKESGSLFANLVDIDNHLNRIVTFRYLHKTPIRFIKPDGPGVFLRIDFHEPAANLFRENECKGKDML
jgi:hypothetical protein